MKEYGDIINKIKNHKLGDKEDAIALYFSFCNILKEKHGPVDKDYDDKPTKRGKEWIDIHHIQEYELDDIAKRTENAYDLANEQKRHPGEVLIIKSEIFHDKEKFNQIKKLNPNVTHFYALDYTLEELKPYNVKEKLVYANKIEHFLLHFLIDSIRGKNIKSGGPNYLWDSCVSLEIYAFTQDYLIKLQHNRTELYSDLSSRDITILYKRLIDWKGWGPNYFTKFWYHINKIMLYIAKDRTSYITDKDKFFDLLGILNIEFDDETKKEIEALPFKGVPTLWKGKIPAKIFMETVLSEDEKTAIRFDGIRTKKSFTIPYYIEHILNGAFIFARNLETITIPCTVKTMEDDVFTEYLVRFQRKCCPRLQKVIYKGSKDDWDIKFSNVKLNNIKLICK